MRFLTVTVLLILETARVAGQPAPSFRPDELKRAGGYVNVELKGRVALHPRQQVDVDPRVLTDYDRGTGVAVSSSAGYAMPTLFDLFLGGDDNLPGAAKRLDGKWAAVQGELVIVHSPAIFTYFGTGYQHAMPRFVVRVSRLAEAPEPEAGQLERSLIKVEVKGLLQTNGTNLSRRSGNDGTLDDLAAGKATIGTQIHSIPCGFLLVLGQKSEWLDAAKGLNGKPAIVHGNLMFQKHNWKNAECAEVMKLMIPPG